MVDTEKGHSGHMKTNFNQIHIGWRTQWHKKRLHTDN